MTKNLSLILNSTNPLNSIKLSKNAKKLAKLKQIYGDLCVYCLDRISNSIDHIIPVVRNGRNVFENLLPVCQKCNCDKNSLSIYYFCSKKILVKIDANRIKVGYCQLLKYKKEKHLPILRNVVKPDKTTNKILKHSIYNDLHWLPYTEHSKIILDAYMSASLYLENDAKKIFTLMFIGQYNKALELISIYRSTTIFETKLSYCNSELDYLAVIKFLELFFRNQTAILENISIINFLLP